MKKINLTRLTTIVAIVLLFAACKKEHITGGIIEDVNKYKNITTYDYLKTNPLYDTLVKLIDTAGLKDKINQDGMTIFAPSDYAVLNYLKARTDFVHNFINLNSNFALDSLFYYLRNNIKGTKDSLMMYLIKKPLTYDVLTKAGAFYPTELPGDTAIISYEETLVGSLGYNSIVSGIPRVIYYTHMWKRYHLSADSTAAKIPESTGLHTLVKTSNIITKNGIVNALDDSHNLFFYRTK